MAVRHYTGVLDLAPAETIEVLDLAAKLKRKWNKKGKPSKRLRGYTLAAIFEKPSLRTRTTFEAGMTQLGGHSTYLGPSDIQIGQRESVPDIARNLSRWVQIIMARTFAHSTVMQLAEWSTVPVINGLSDLEHPCQALADFQTLREQLGDDLAGKQLVYVGDGNNVAHSLMLMGAQLGMHVTIATPEGYAPRADVLEQAQQAAAATGARITASTDLHAAVRGADAVYTDVWTSMGQEAEAEQRRAAFAGFQVNRELLDATGNPSTIVMHCLPAHRDEEVSAEVIDGPRSVIFDQAENRLHAQKALILWLLTH